MAMNPLPSNKHLVKSVISGFALHPGFVNLILESPLFSANCVRFKSHITLFGISRKGKAKAVTVAQPSCNVISCSIMSNGEKLCIVFLTYKVF